VRSNIQVIKRLSTFSTKNSPKIYLCFSYSNISLLFGEIGIKNLKEAARQEQRKAVLLCNAGVVDWKVWR
jgi:hypothetical protein